jgi:hypothetical protein
MQLDKSSEFT